MRAVLATSGSGGGAAPPSPPAQRGEIAALLPAAAGGAAGGGRGVVALCVLIACTGLFHGYDNAVVSEVFQMDGFRGMMSWPADDDGRVAFQKGLVVNGFNVGAAVAALLSGHFLVDRYGRKPALLLGSVLFAVGGAVQAFAREPLSLVAGRLVAGVGVGITSCAGPAYIAEVAPAASRGAMVGLYQMNICIALVGASVLNWCVKDAADGWRWSLGVQIVLGGVTAVGMVTVPETPRFLERCGRSGDALRVLARICPGGEAAAREELAAVRAELAEEDAAGAASWGEICSNPHFRNVVVIGCLVQFLQIITGINAMVSFGGTLFEDLGVRGLVSAVVPNVAFLVGNILGSRFLVDRVGRRPIMLWGMVGMAATMLAGGIIAIAAPRDVYPAVAPDDESASGSGTYADAPGYAIISMVVGFMFTFGASWGYGAWLYIPEIMPLRVRGKAVGLCTGANWGPANVASAFLTPMMIDSRIGAGGTLLFFGAMSLLTVPFALACLPETKGRALEEVAPLFRFEGCAGFARFASGNIRTGTGAEHHRNGATGGSGGDLSSRGGDLPAPLAMP